MSDLCDEIQKLGKGVSNAARYRILEAVAGGPKTVGDLTKVAKMSQPAVSQHLKTLKACALVNDEKRGQEVYYSLNAEYTLRILKEFLVNLSKPAPKKSRAVFRRT
ncbi:MAG TPA: metalloregulator ArsR/SmtB family transcription factor [Candidatus Paceibacterota bacterium]|jgi:DNA-binding transcriptional ArsR family regulator|nr:metalloregulator ArsR/SmtB family transcription factor [Candidatus Paceibacterota bacterium]